MRDFLDRMKVRLFLSVIFWCAELMLWVIGSLLYFGIKDMNKLYRPPSVIIMAVMLFIAMLISMGMPDIDK